MGHGVTRKPDVRRDLSEQADYIARGSVDAASRFLDAVEATFEFLADNCDIGQVCAFEDPRTLGLRVWPIRGFPNHLVFYLPTKDGVDIIRVLHGARDLNSIFSPD
jgi:toxin ParE1/3/4